MEPEYYIFTGRDGEVIPDHITHVLIDKALKFVRARAFLGHPNIEEVICHDSVEKFEKLAFSYCGVRRVVMPGVKNIEEGGFNECRNLTYVECGKLEIIGEWAFCACTSLSSIDLPFIKIAEMSAFCDCKKLINARFGKDLESIGREAFYKCPSLECITLPLKDGMISHDDAFRKCDNLHHVVLVGGVYETVAALLLEEWRNDMNEEIDSISQILPNTFAGTFYSAEGDKARAIRTWIESVHRKYIHYKAEHYRYVNEAAAILQPALPNDILLKNVLPFVELPSDTGEGRD